MQLFAHLLSSYLQGMGDFFSALPWGRLGWGFWGVRYAPPATLEELRFHSPGLRGEAPLPWVRTPLYLATLKELRLAEGVMLNLILLSYTVLAITLLRVTPTAKRNSYRVAILVGRLPRVASFARNPGLGRRNSYRVAMGAHRLQWDKHTWL